MIGAWIAKRKVPKFFDALNRRDVEAFLKNWADDAMYIYPGNMAGISGRHMGKKSIQTWFQNMLKQFPALRFTIQHVAINNPLAMTGSNIIATHFNIDVTNREGQTIHNSGVAVTTVRRGKIIHDQIFLFDTGEKFRTAWGEGKQ